MSEEVESRVKLPVHVYNYIPGENNSVVIYLMSFIKGRGKAV